MAPFAKDHTPNKYKCRLYFIVLYAVNGLFVLRSIPLIMAIAASSTVWGKSDGSS